MPVGHTTLRQQSHAQRRGIDYAYAALLEIVKIVGNGIVVKTIMAETKHTLHGARRHMVYYIFYVWQLQVGDSHMAHHTLLFQLHQCRQCLLHNHVE